jgi:hypothetical protein
MWRRVALVRTDISEFHPDDDDDDDGGNKFLLMLFLTRATRCHILKDGILQVDICSQSTSACCTIYRGPQFTDHLVLDLKHLQRISRVLFEHDIKMAGIPSLHLVKDNFGLKGAYSNLSSDGRSILDGCFTKTNVNQHQSYIWLEHLKQLIIMSPIPSGPTQ